MAIDAHALDTLCNDPWGIRVPCWSTNDSFCWSLRSSKKRTVASASLKERYRLGLVGEMQTPDCAYKGEFYHLPCSRTGTGTSLSGELPCFPGPPLVPLVANPAEDRCHESGGILRFYKGSLKRHDRPCLRKSGAFFKELEASLRFFDNSVDLDVPCLRKLETL